MPFHIGVVTIPVTTLYTLRLSKRNNVPHQLVSLLAGMIVASEEAALYSIHFQRYRLTTYVGTRFCTTILSMNISVVQWGS
jgi:NhaP-type Na+/H+ and K+/H+ antiporter